MNQYGSNNITARARKLGLNPNTVRERIRKGMDPDTALTTPLMRRPPTCTLELCLRHRIDQRTVKSRMARGMTLREALTSPVNTSQSRKLTREQRIQAEWNKPAKEVVRELRAEGKSKACIAGILQACHSWVHQTICEIEAEQQSKLLARNA